ncbi:hypothetical protein ACKLNR_005560 [Fusarium oxysporum f. sp. zingiberi]
MRVDTAIVLRVEIEKDTLNDRNQRVEVSVQGQRPSSYSSSETWLETGGLRGVARDPIQPNTSNLSLASWTVAQIR